jgi:hypothetical protein
MIHGRCHTADNTLSLEFDATPWFKEAEFTVPAIIIAFIVVAGEAILLYSLAKMCRSR